jgi:NaMN:DMB phosphoribosyltransferase
VGKKCEVVGHSLKVNEALIKAGPLGALRAVGGLEIAAMVGAYVEASPAGRVCTHIHPTRPLP